MKHLVLFFISILSLSQAASLARLAAAPPLMIGFWRMLGAAIFILLFRYWKSRKTNQNTQVVPRSAWAWIFISGSFFFLHLWTFFYAAQNTTIANCMVIFATNPVFTSLGAWLLLKDRFEVRYGVAFSFAFVGITVLVSDHLDWTPAGAGDLSALASAIFFSVYLLTSKKARLQVSTSQLTGLIYAGAAMLFLITGRFQGIEWFAYSPVTWFAIAGTILIPTFLGHVLFTELLKRFNIHWMSCGKLLEPALSALVAYFVFSENLKTKTYVSFFFTGLAVLVFFWPLLWNRKNISADKL